MLFDHSKICAQISAIPLGHVEPETVKAIATALAAAIKKSHGAGVVDSWAFHAQDMLTDLVLSVDYYNDTSDSNEEDGKWSDHE